VKTRGLSHNNQPDSKTNLQDKPENQSEKNTGSAVLSNPLVTHWRGEYALLPTLILVVLSIRIALGWMQDFVPPRWTNSWLAFSTAVYIWQLVGTSRSADRYFKLSGDTLAVFMAYGTMLILTILTVTQSVDAITAANKPHPPVLTTPTLPVLQSDNAIVVKDSLDWEMFAAFKRTLIENPDIETVHLESTGGYVFVARAMALIILEKKLATHVKAQCYSACTLVFMAGNKRTISTSARMGFHRYQINAKNQQGLIDISQEHKKDRTFFSTRGASNSFIDQMFSRKHTELWVPNHQLLQEAGVVTEPLASSK